MQIKEFVQKNIFHLQQHNVLIYDYHNVNSNINPRRPKFVKKYSFFYFMLIHLFLIIEFLPIILCEDDIYGTNNYTYIGCYTIPVKLLQNSLITGNVHTCVMNCELSFNRYAVLSPEDRCSCSNELMSDAEKLDIGLCNIRCSKIKSQFCGGIGAASYYTTGLSGAPRNIRITNVSESSIDIEWERTRKEDQVTTFKIIAKVEKTFATYSILMNREWTLQRSENRFSLSDLNSGTKYLISISALCGTQDCGTNSTYGETLIGDPDPSPKEPKIVNRTATTLTIELVPAVNNNGPITFVRIIVHIIDDVISQDFDPEYLGNYNRSLLDGVPYYITAEQRFFNATNSFVVGDGSTYRGFYNAPLPPKAHVHIILGFISIHNGITRTKYSPASHEQHNPLGITFYDMKEDQQPSILVLTIACVVLGILLVFSIIAYFFLRYKTTHARQRLSDTHELTIQGPMVEVENNGFAIDEFTKGNFKTQLNQIIESLDNSQRFPRNLVRINVNDVIANGKFGEVLTGKLNLNSQSFNCECHVVSDDMELIDQAAFLKEFDQLIRLMPHDRFVNFYGISASPDWFYILFEQYPISLKKKLIDSRLSQNMNNKTFSSLTEETIIQWIFDIAVGMEYLEVNKAIHKRLCSYNIFVTDFNQIKISLFGPPTPYGDIENKSIDLKRWLAPETLRYNHRTIKSDVWSFACVAWECCSLGGTLYNGIASPDLLQRIKNGIRPEQPNFLYSDLYQLLLNCWQLDPSERPEFEEIAFNVRQLLTSPKHVINFDCRENVTIPYYLPLLEIEN